MDVYHDDDVPPGFGHRLGSPPPPGFHTKHHASRNPKIEIRTDPEALRAPIRLPPGFEDFTNTQQAQPVSAAHQKALADADNAYHWHPVVHASQVMVANGAHSLQRLAVADASGTRVNGNAHMQHHQGNDAYHEPALSKQHQQYRRQKPIFQHTRHPAAASSSSTSSCSSEATYYDHGGAIHRSATAARRLQHPPTAGPDPDALTWQQRDMQLQDHSHHQQQQQRRPGQQYHCSHQPQHQTHNQQHSNHVSSHHNQHCQQPNPFQSHQQQHVRASKPLQPDDYGSSTKAGEYGQQQVRHTSARAPRAHRLQASSQQQQHSWHASEAGTAANGRRSHANSQTGTNASSRSSSHTAINLAVTRNGSNGQTAKIHAPQHGCHAKSIDKPKAQHSSALRHQSTPNTKHVSSTTVNMPVDKLQFTVDVGAAVTAAARALNGISAQARAGAAAASSTSAASSTCRNSTSNSSLTVTDSNAGTKTASAPGHASADDAGCTAQSRSVLPQQLQSCTATLPSCSPAVDHSDISSSTDVNVGHQLADEQSAVASNGVLHESAVGSNGVLHESAAASDDGTLHESAVASDDGTLHESAVASDDGTLHESAVLAHTTLHESAVVAHSTLHEQLAALQAALEEREADLAEASLNLVALSSDKSSLEQQLASVKQQKQQLEMALIMGEVAAASTTQQHLATA
eukprot:jgi/Chrzof1/2939/Cz12g05060.t1